jgi:hypothetical protein
MTNHPHLSNLDDLRKVVSIIHLVESGIQQIKMHYQADDGSLQPIRWTASADDELYSCPLPVVTDTIIPLMSMVTGHKFQRSCSTRGKNVFERLDYIQSCNTETHN